MGECGGMRGGLRRLFRDALAAGLATCGVTCGVLAAPVDFAREVLPVLSDNCFQCHGPDEAGRKAGLRLDQRDSATRVLKSGRAAIVAGQPAASELVSRLFTTDADDLMPPAESHRELTGVQKELLRRWVAEGAVWGRHWGFDPVRPVDPPSVRNDAWTRNELDRFVLARLEAEGMEPSPEAELEILARRVALDLTGLPPSEEDLGGLKEGDPDVAYARYVERLLASVAYGERMAGEWMDLARYADTYGFQADVERDMSPWRDWVIRAYNENLSYDRFLTWQLAGDLLPGATTEQVMATAFNRLHRQTNEGGSIEEEWRAEYVSDRVHTLGTAVLGLTLECSRCHDHKYDPVSQRDYYSLSALFNNIDESGLYSHFTAATPTPTLFLYGEGEERRHGELLEAVKVAERRVAEVVKVGKVLEAGVEVTVPAPVARYTFDAVEGGRSPNAMSTNGAAEGAIRLVAGREGQGLEFDGDDAVTCRGVGRFARWQAFTMAAWIRPAELQARAVVLHGSRAWTDSGSRGYELVLESGRPQFALIHFWPGNAVAIRGKEALTVGEWTHVTVSYDGSSRAEGMKLYLNGRPAPVEVVRDHLYKDIRHRREWGDSEVDALWLTLGARFRDNGFRKGGLDELQVWDVALLPGEVARVAGLGWVPGPEEMAQWQAWRANDRVAEARAELAKAREEEDRFVTGLKEMMVMREMAKPRVTHVLNRGAYDAPGAQVEAGVPREIFGAPLERPDRLGLARWLTDPRHPLTGRVAVNRVWALHFGRGLVTTVEDFGMQGRGPTHPELLDWLTQRFVGGGWDRKALHRLIVMSATYRQASEVRGPGSGRDPENVLLGRGPRHRLPAEVVRDRALAASGLLVRKVGGRSVKPYQPAGVWEESGTGKTYVQDKGEALYRRSLYTFWRRTAPPPSMLTFDAPSREVCTAKRETTATPMQALVLLNDTQFIEAARVLAETVWVGVTADRDRVATVFRRMIGREAGVRELEILERLLAEQRRSFGERPEAAVKFLAIGERRGGAGIEPVELAAATVLVSTVMNHDEFVMKR